MPQKKKQHYVPSFYLNHFTVKQDKEKFEDYLWIYEKPTKKVFKRAPKNIGFQNYFYSVKVEEEISSIIEDGLAEIELLLDLTAKEVAGAGPLPEEVTHAAGVQIVSLGDPVESREVVEVRGSGVGLGARPEEHTDEQTPDGKCAQAAHGWDTSTNSGATEPTALCMQILVPAASPLVAHPAMSEKF